MILIRYDDFKETRVTAGNFFSIDIDSIIDSITGVLLIFYFISNIIRISKMQL